MTTTETTDHEHMFPLATPGVFESEGPCEGCGLTREQALTGDRIREQGQAAQAAFYAHFGTDADNGVAEIDEQHRPAWEAAALAVAGPIERERNILRGQLECAELTITDYRNALTAQCAEFDRLSAPLSEARITAPMLAAAFRRLRVVTVAPDGMPLEHGPLAAAILEGFAEEARASSRAAIEEAARDLDFRFRMAESILAAFPPPVRGVEIPLAAIFDTAHPRFLECDELRAMYAAHPAVRSVIDAAVGIEARKAIAS